MTHVPTVTVHGAAGTVTGSCYEVALGSRRILVDCGLFQGSRTLEALNRQPFAFDPRKIDAVVLSHAHLDHAGLLPRLAAEGFRGPIWCTAPTADLLAVMLPDAAKIHEQDAERRNRRTDRADEPPIAPLYTLADAERALGLLKMAALDTSFAPAAGFDVRLWNAGHILGSASVEVVAGGSKLLFSGDLGPSEKSFHPDPEGPIGVDQLFCESTYGDREREQVTPEQRRALLADEVNTALAKDGNLVIPVFALERTQELLLDLAALMDADRIRTTPVFIDSPLASRATAVFRRHAALLEDLAENDIFAHAAFHFTDSVDESIRLNSVSGAIILAASGMCEAGRIRHHLLRNLPRANSTVLFVGYQAQGTLGRTILEGAKRVRISGRDVAVRAAIRRLDSYSAHADRAELLAWIAARRPVSGSVFLTHGEPAALLSLGQELQRLGSSVVIPEIGETWQLPAGAHARRLRTGRVELRQALSHDWQNDYADFAANLKRKLQRIPSGRQRAEAVARMREILETYARDQPGRESAAQAA